MPRAFPAVLLLVAAACANGDGDRGAPGGADATSGTVPDLPAPEGAIGSVTGMPAHPGPGTSPIQAVQSAEPAPGAWTDDGYAGVEPIDDVEAMSVQPSFPESPLAEGPPIIMVPVVPHESLATAVDPDVPAPPAPPARPIGTEGATESTTFVAEPEDTDD